MSTRLARSAAGLQLVTGWVLARHPHTGLRLLGYPEDRAASRAVLRLLGTRQLVQGALELRPTPAVLYGGAAVDVLHAATCVAYARRTEVGRRAGLRNAAFASAVAALEVVAARRLSPSPEQPPPSGEPFGLKPAQRAGLMSLPARLARSGKHLTLLPAAGPVAWPEPTDPRPHVLAGGVTEQLVALRGGVMDGAVVSVEPGSDHYDIVNADEGPQRYTATGERDEAGWEVFALDDARE